MYKYLAETQTRVKVSKVSEMIKILKQLENSNVVDIKVENLIS